MLYKLQNPAPGRPVTSGYGYRIHPISGGRKMHRGIDYGGQFDVLAAGDGTVTHIGWSPRGGGHVVKIKHATDCYTVYYHGAHRTQLKKGQHVHAGDKVYLSGTTGSSTGNHVHFEVRTGRTGAWGTNTDPNPYFSASSATAPTNNTLRVTGRLDKDTWKVWQEELRDHGYRGVIDARPGKLTWSAVQRSGVAFGYPANDIDGLDGPNTRRAVQRRLAASGYYDGRIDALWGRGTISALQRALNDGKY